MHDIDVLIVGQGLAGSLLYHELEKRMLSACVISSSQIPAATKVAAGMVNPLVFKRVVPSWMAVETYPIMYQTYAEIEAKLGKKLFYELPILKLIGEKELDWWLERSKDPAVSKFIDSIEEYPKYIGIQDYRACAKIRQCGYLDAASFLIHYRNYLTTAGKLLDEVFSYEQLKINDNRILYKSIRCNKLVFCEGVHAMKNPFFKHVVFYPTKGEVLSFEDNNLEFDAIINKDVFIMPRSGSFLSGSTYIRSDLTWDPSLEGRDQIINKLSKILNKNPTKITLQAGVRPTIKDRRPVLGLHPKHQNIGIFNGLGTKGVSLAPYFANIMAELISANNVERIHQEFDSSRFLH